MKQTLRSALDDRGYDSLTPVQTAVTNPDYDGCDLLVSAQTGSGKTLGFGLAIAPTILRDADSFDAAAAPLALVIAPTRELAMQVMRELSWLFARAGAVVTSCVGGMDMREERRAMARGAHIVVATPGRLRDHIMRASIDLSSVRAVVLDEADEMLDLGFREDLEFILGETPETRQTLLFSATVPKSIAQLAENYQKDAVRVLVQSETSQHADIDYLAMQVADRDADNAVINTLRFHEAPNALVFANTRAMVNRLTTRLSNRGFSVVALSGELSQTERTHALQAMRDGRARVCVATDVAARGIDLPNLDLVIHAELPTSHETLLHRSGRTGRAGRKGVSALIVTPKAARKAERILNMAKVRATWGAAPSAEDVIARDEERLFADPVWTEPVPEAQAAAAEKLAATFSAAQIAAAYLRLYHAQRTAPEDLSDPANAPKPRPKEEFGPSVWFTVSMGRDQNAEPRRILPILCKAGGVSRDDIGAIRVQADASFVQIREASVDAFLAHIGPGMVLEEGVTLTRLAVPPVIDMARNPVRKPAGKSADRPQRSAPRDAASPEYSRRPEPAAAPEPARTWTPTAAEPQTTPRPESETPPAVQPKAPYKKKEFPAKSAPRDAAPAADAPRPKWKSTHGARPAKPASSDAGGRSEGGAKPWAKGPGGKPKPRGDAEARTGYGGKPIGKPAGKPSGKPGGQAGGKPAGKPWQSGKSAPAAAGGEARPAYKPKGPPPPAGKPDSKKNRARAADTSQSLRTGKPRGPKS